MLMNPEREEREYLELMQAKQSAQDTYVREWRLSHWAWSDTTWRCPLCSRILQAFTDSDVMYIATQHQIDHGADWVAYEAAGAAEQRDGANSG
jgi:hypothetical protein